MFVMTETEGKSDRDSGAKAIAMNKIVHIALNII